MKWYGNIYYTRAVGDNKITIGISNSCYLYFQNDILRKMCTGNCKNMEGGKQRNLSVEGRQKGF
jgi:hypothetical protein